MSDEYIIEELRDDKMLEVKLKHIGDKKECNRKDKMYIDIIINTD